MATIAPIVWIGDSQSASGAYPLACKKALNLTDEQFQWFAQGSSFSGHYMGKLNNRGLQQAQGNLGGSKGEFSCAKDAYQYIKNCKPKYVIVALGHNGGRQGISSYQIQMFQELKGLGITPILVKNFPSYAGEVGKQNEHRTVNGMVGFDKVQMKWVYEPISNKGYITADLTNADIPLNKNDIHATESGKKKAGELVASQLGGKLTIGDWIAPSGEGKGIDGEGEEVDVQKEEKVEVSLDTTTYKDGGNADDFDPFDTNLIDDNSFSEDADYIVTTQEVSVNSENTDAETETTKTAKGLSIEEAISILQDSKSSVVGEDVKANVKLADKKRGGTMRKVQKISKSLMSVLPTLYTLLENYSVNKLGLVEDASSVTDALLESNANSMGLTPSSVSEARTRSIDTSNTKKVHADINQGSGQQASSSRFMKCVSELEESDSQDIFLPMGEELSTSSGKYSYSCPSGESVLFSEIDRVIYNLDANQSSCRKDERKPIKSLSTRDNGGLIENLGFSGNTREEMIKAILTDINNGERI